METHFQPDPGTWSDASSEESLRRSIERHAALLPPLPSLVLQIQEGIDDPWIDLRRLVRLIRTDPNIAGPVLRLANSVHHRGTQEIVELEDALQRIGVSHLRLIVTALGAAPSVRVAARARIDGRRHRLHSLLVATVAAHLGRNAGLGSHSLERLWMAGLLHDQGAMILPVLEPDSWSKVVDEPPPPATAAVDLVERERELLPWDHAQVGATFLERTWSFPAAIAELVRTWHDPELAGDDAPLAECIRRADISARALGHCWQPAWSREASDDEECGKILSECLPLVRALLPED